MADIYLDETTRRRLANRWITATMVFLHLWATLLVVAVLRGRDSAIVAGMFDTCTFGIGATLVILLFDRAADAVLAKFTGTPNTKETVKTTEHTVEKLENPAMRPLLNWLTDKLLTPVKTWLNRYIIYIKLASAAVLVVGIFWAGIEVQYNLERARELERARVQAEADAAAQAKIAELGNGLWAALELLRQNGEKAEGELRHEVEKVDCRNQPLSADTVRLLNQ